MRAHQQPHDATAAPISHRHWLLGACLAVLQAVSLTSPSPAAAQAAGTSVTSECAVVGYQDTVATEPYWEAVPPDLLFVPVTYLLYLPGPLPQDVLAQLTIEVVDASSAVVVTGGEVTDVRLLSGEVWLLSWTPAVPLEPGQYFGRMVGGDFPDPVECLAQPSGHIVYAPFSFPFTVEDSAKDWVQGAELTLREPGGGGGSVPTTCCEVAADDCLGNEGCFQCWDFWAQPVVYAEWSGPGIAYLQLESRGRNLDPDAVPPRLGGTLPIGPSGTLLEVFSLTGYGDYCLEGTVSTGAMESRTIEACGSFTEEQHLGGEASPREDCRTRVPARTCAALPERMTDLANLYVVRGATEDDARAALDAAPYDTLRGCYAIDSPAPPAVGSGGGSSQVADAGPVVATSPDASATDETDAGGATSPTSANPDANEPVAARVSGSSSNESGCSVSRRGSSVSGFAVLILVGLGLRTRRGRGRDA